jgi:hypothetical protein
MSFFDEIPAALVANIVKCLPIYDQAGVARGLLDEDYVSMFEERNDYLWAQDGSDIDETLGGKPSWFTKDGEELLFYGRHGRNYKVGFFVVTEYEFGITNLPDVVPAGSVHKLGVWNRLFKEGMVSEYNVCIVNEIQTEMEKGKITVRFRNVPGSCTRFTMELKVELTENNSWGYYIANGSRTVEFEYGAGGGIPDLTFGQGAIVEESWHDDVEILTFEDGTYVAFTDPHDCEFERYTFGVSKEVLTAIFV